MIAIAALLLPPAKDFFYSKTNKELSLKSRAVSIFVLFIVSSIFTGQSQDKKAQELAAEQAQKQAEKIAQIRQENISHFNANHEQIISSAKAAFSAKEYQSVISQSSKYLDSGDKELEQLNNQAKTELAEIQKSEKAAKEKIEKETKTKDLLEKLKTISASQYELNEHFYQQLVNYNPENGPYREKLTYYSGKVREEQEKERIEKEKIKKEEFNKNLARSNPEQFLEIVKFSWSKEGFGNVMEANFTIKNKAPIDIKDFEVRCEHSAASGSLIDSNNQTIYDIVKANSTRTFRNVNMGFIHSQASRSSCNVVSAKSM